MGSFVARYYPYILALNVLIFPSSKLYWPTRLVTEGSLASIVWRIPFMFLEWYLAANGIFVVAFLGLLMVVHLNVLKFGIKLLR